MKAYIVMHGFDHEGLDCDGGAYEVYLTREAAEAVPTPKPHHYSTVIELSLPPLADIEALAVASHMQAFRAALPQALASKANAAHLEKTRAEIVKQGTGW